MTEQVAQLARVRQQQVEQLEAAVYLAQLRGRLDDELNAVIFLVRSLAAFVSANPDSGADRWHNVSRQVLGETDLVRNIGLAPDNIIRFVYPLEGNEQALGLDYRRHAEQWPPVERAMTTGRMTLQGPIELVQGGQGLLAQMPISYSSGGQPRYWGVASIVIHFDRLLANAGVSVQQDGYELAIRTEGGPDAVSRLLLGDARVFERPLAQVQIYMPDTHWVLAMRQTPVEQRSLLIIRVVGVLLSLLLAGSIVLWREFRQTN
ncbi:CHASE domain-containing protein [Marinobacterium weihaiense]|uniref:CHASE domain-containing protein n=1 Tax=Marinobacterium weihaiense TaxID=2851016 RepID=A0ABS6M771_9GAMM|nr:CHASE domain-containing protein [Marinobacterium weihaiense]MBV0932129.1 CHASE domain-containing protein [Marinobacterium weihaiense]